LLFPPIAIGTPIGFRLTIGEPVWLAVGLPPCELGDPGLMPPRILFNGFVTETGRPIGERSIIGELLAVAGSPLPPTATGTPIGFKLMIGDDV